MNSKELKEKLEQITKYVQELGFDVDKCYISTHNMYTVGSLLPQQMRWKVSLVIIGGAE